MVAFSSTTLRLMTLAAGLALAACTPEDPPKASVESGADDACGAAALQAHVGQNTESLPAEAKARARILGPNDPMTRDLRPDRLNVLHDGAHIITKIHCG